MFNRFLVACIAFAAISAQAVPVTFTSWQFNADAIAVSDGLPDVQSASSVADLISASAASIGNDVATAGAIVGAGLLSTSADVTGAGSNATSAVASAHFLGAFATTGSVLLGLDFSSSSFLSGSGGGGSTLFVTLMSGGATVYSDFLTGSRLFSYNAAPGTIGTLELTLSSEANAGFLSADAGGFSTAGLVSITTPVPELETLLLLLIGLPTVGLVIRRRTWRSSPR